MSARMTEETAGTIALQALTFLLGDAHHLNRFMSLTGLAADDLRAGAETRELQVAVLDHILSDESLLLAFCQEHRVAPETMAPAQAVLMAGDET